MKTSHALHWRKRGEASSTIIPEKGILVMATQRGEALEIYNFTENTTQTVRYGPNGRTSIRNLTIGGNSKAGIMGFSDVHITDHFIYTVFHGRSFKDIGQAYQRGEDIEDGGRYIATYSTSKETPSGSTCSTMPFMVST